MEHYKKMAELVDDEHALANYALQMDAGEFGHLLNYLVKFKKSRDSIKRAFETRKTEEYGVTPQWQSIRNDPVKYQRRVEYNRLYRQRKRQLHQEKQNLDP